MKRTLFVSSLMAVALLGAGCSQTPSNDQYVPPAPAPSDTAPSMSESQNPYPLQATPAGSTSTATTTEPVTLLAPTSTMSQLAFPGVMPEAQVNKKVLIKTNLGNIEIQVDPKAGPNAASNFIYLVKQGFYNGTIFHRVIPGFMIQGGDPTGTGRGGPGYQFANDPVNGSYNKGIVAMANAGPDTNGSQFFIMVADVPLHPDYSIFGHVISGQDVADKISQVQTTTNDGGENSQPVQQVKVLDVSVE